MSDRAAELAADIARLDRLDAATLALEKRAR